MRLTLRPRCHAIRLPRTRKPQAERVAAWAVGAIVALRAGAPDLATGLLGAQIVFAGVFLRLVCHGTRRGIKALQAQIEAGGPVAVANPGAWEPVYGRLAAAEARRLAPS